MAVTVPGVERLVTVLEAADVQRVCFGDGPTGGEREAWDGTSLVVCAGERGGCGRGAIVTGPEDAEILLGLVDDLGWSLRDGWWRCDRCPPADGSEVAGVAVVGGRTGTPVPVDVRCAAAGCVQRMRGELGEQYVEGGLRPMVRALGWRWEDGPAAQPVCPQHAPVADGAPCWRPERHEPHDTYRGYPGDAVPIRKCRCPGRGQGPDGVPVSWVSDRR